MVPGAAMMQAVEQLNYRVTVGDVAAQAGLEVNQARQVLLKLAEQCRGDLQVAESGEIVYLFPRDFRAVLRNKVLRLRLQEGWQKIWWMLFYIIRISFGMILILSIVLIFLALATMIISVNSQRNSDNQSSQGDRQDTGFTFFFPHFGLSSEWFRIFQSDYSSCRYQTRHNDQGRAKIKPTLNFLEAVFSFLFGDGNPNADLEEKRWQIIASVIRQSGGAIAAEQVLPYLDRVNTQDSMESYMIPVLVRFNGKPAVSPTGDIIYVFPDLQVMAAPQKTPDLPPYLREHPWQFSAASSGQMTGAIALGGVNCAGALMLGVILYSGNVAVNGGLLGFVSSIYGLLLAYGVGFLIIPLVRYLWLHPRNQAIASRNQARQQAAQFVQENPALEQKLAYAQQFAAKIVITPEDLAYTTERNLLEQADEYPLNEAAN